MYDSGGLLRGIFLRTTEHSSSTSIHGPAGYGSRHLQRRNTASEDGGGVGYSTIQEKEKI